MLRHTMLCCASMVCLVLCVSCGPSAERKKTVAEEDLMSVARDYIEKERPEWEPDFGLPYKITDKGRYWEVTFELPEG